MMQRRSGQRWQQGETILDLYQVKELLGKGGFGEVYQVHHPDWNLDLAMKVPRPDQFTTQQDVEAFEREAETWVNLGLHPHTVSCYYVRRDQTSPLVFVEYVAGGSLADWIHNGKLYAGGTDVALQRILDIAIQFAWGLHYAHEQGLIHQDVKPGNVMLTPEGIAKVTDFGLAKATAIPKTAAGDSQTMTLITDAGAMTPAYCSPEQAQGSKLTRRTDLWSWAVSLLEMFASSMFWMQDAPPSFPIGIMAATALEAYLTGKPAVYSFAGVEFNINPPSQQAGLQMPKVVSELLQWCFQEQEQDRPSTMLVVADKLRQIYQQVTGAPYPRQLTRRAADEASSLNNRALSLWDLGKATEALQLWDEALKLDPHHLDAAYNRGLARWRRGEIHDVDVVKELENLQLYNGRNWRCNYLLALVHLERNDYEAAIQCLKASQQLETHNPILEQTLQVAYHRQPISTQCLKTLTGHISALGSVCLSRDGRLALSDSKDSTLKLWDVQTGTCLKNLTGHINSMKSAAAFLSNRDNTVNLDLTLHCSMMTARYHLKTRYADAVTSVSLSGDGHVALSGSSDHTLKLWDVQTGECLRTLTGHTNSVNSVCLSGDGHVALSGSKDKTLKLWDVQTGDCLRTFTGHTNFVTSVCLSGNGRLALSGSQDDTLKLWDGQTGDCLRTLTGHANWVTSVCLSGDGRLALSGSKDKTLKLWDVQTGRCLKTLTGHAGAVTSVCLSGDGHVALSGSDDNTLKLWNMQTGKCLRTLTGHTNSVNSVCLSGDGRLALSGSEDKTLRLWQLKVDQTDVAALSLSQVTHIDALLANQTRYEQTMQAATGMMNCQDYSGAAQHLRPIRQQLGGRYKAEVWQIWKALYDHLPRTSLQGWVEIACQAGHTDSVYSVCLSGDGRLALSGSRDSTLKLWDVQTGRCLRTFTGHKDWVNSVCLSGDGRLALSGSRGSTLKLWDVQTGRCLRTFTGHKDWVNSVCLSGDGHLALSGSSDHTLKLWDVQTGACLRTLINRVTSVCLSGDERLALSGSRDGTLKLWDVQTGDCLRTFTGHTKFVTSVYLSGDGRVALSGSWDSTLRLWNGQTGACLQTFTGHTDDVNSVCLSGDGRLALSGSNDRTLKLWDVRLGICLRTIQYPNEVTAVAVSANEQVAVVAVGDTMRVLFLDWELDDSGGDSVPSVHPYLLSP